MSKNIGNEWWTSPTESIETGNLIMVTGRRGVEPLRNSGKYGIRVEITWPYASDKSGMPDKPTSMIMEAVHEAMLDEFKKDPVAVTGCSMPETRTSLRNVLMWRWLLSTFCL